MTTQVLKVEGRYIVIASNGDIVFDLDGNTTSSVNVIGNLVVDGIVSASGFDGIGVTGFTGSQGFTGSLGFTGSQGETGFTGSQGELGFTGSIGFTGSQGETGFTGSQGELGFTGSQGELGFTGSIGFTGSQGETGFTGSQGELGFTGSQGDLGFTGSQGEFGFTGSKGDPGGFTGSRGFTGSQGLPVTITATNGLIGGGLLDQDRSIELDVDYTNNLYVRLTGSTLTGFLVLNDDPVVDLHAATKRYVDQVARQLKVLPAAKAATTENLSADYDNGADGVGATLTATANGEFPTVDDVTSLTVGDNVLVKDQNNAAHNGSYVITDPGSPTTPWVLTRCDFCDEPIELPGSYEFVTLGTTNGSTGWVLTVETLPIIIGTTNIFWRQFSGPGTYTAGDGLTLTGKEFSVNVDDQTIEITTGTLQVKDGGIDNQKITNPFINFNADTGTVTSINLGQTVNFYSGEGIETEVTSGTITILGGYASVTVRGIASFGGWADEANTVRQFSVNTGDVTISVIDCGSY